MKIFASFAVFCAIFLATSLAQDKTFAKSRVAFALALFRNISYPQTMIISPLSVDLAMSCLFFGSSQVTYLELMSGLQYPKNYSMNLIQSNFQLLMRNLKKVDGLEIATKLYVNSNLVPLQTYKSTITRILNAQIEQINFKENIAAASKINTWVANSTKNLITSVVDAGMLDIETTMVLINCVYFKGSWLHSFPKNLTYSGDFFMDDTKTVKVDFMNNKQRFQYGVLNGLDRAKVLSIPYKKSSMSMLFILPQNKTGLPSLISKLHLFDWTTVDDFMTPNIVNVTIPKFNATFDGILNDYLKKMGMKQIFDLEKVLLDRMLTTSDQVMNVNIDKVIHKAVLRVDEEGTVAAAVTVIAFRAMEYVFKADQPFIFMLRSGSTIIFMGQFLGNEALPIDHKNIIKWNIDSNNNVENTE